MAEQLKSPAPENGGDNQGTGNNPADKEAAEPKKKFQPPKRKARKNSRLTGLEWGGFFVDIYVTLWVWSDLIACHDIKRLVFLLAAVFVAHGVLCYFLSKIFKSWRWALVAWFALSITAAWITYKNYQPFPTNAAESKPVDVVKTLDTNELRAIVVEAVKNANTNVPQTLEIKKVEWQPPELPAGCKWVTVSAVGTIRNPATWPSWNVFGGQMERGGAMIIPGMPMNICARVTNNRLYVDAEVSWDGITYYAVSNMTFFETMPNDWDRNFNSSAFEIVGPDHLPVFQEIYVLPEHIVVNGIFYKKPGIIVGIFDTQLISGFPSEVLAGFPNRKPIFKYPSWKFPGVLAD
jgi:membrane protein implicated in regulation of membrane protease activity